MAYTGFLSDPDYARKSDDNIFAGNNTFTGENTFTQTIQGTALKALWADLAEIYETDPVEVLIPGTIVRFGGKYEITKARPNDRDFFGVISTKPGVILNKKEKHGEMVALVGRVPVRILGKINKFDKITTSKYPGIAKKKTFLDYLLLKPTIGVCLKTDTNENEKLVEVFVKSHIS